MNPDESCAEWRGHAVGFTATEHKVVALLIAAAGVAVSYRTIYDAMRRKGFVSGEGERGHEPCVRTAVKRIRRKFLAIDPGFSEIRNTMNLGYSWEPTVDQIRK
jgi:two-component system response regulator ChvI